MLCNTDERPGRGRRCEGGVYDHEDGDKGNVPPAGTGPVLGILDIVGCEVDVALGIKIRGFVGMEVFGSIGLCGWAREDTDEAIHG